MIPDVHPVSLRCDATPPHTFRMDVEVRAYRSGMAFSVLLNRTLGPLLVWPYLYISSSLILSFVLRMWTLF